MENTEHEIEQDYNIVTADDLINFIITNCGVELTIDELKERLASNNLPLFNCIQSSRKNIYLLVKDAPSWGVLNSEEWGWVKLDD